MKKYFMIAAAALLIASCAKESDALYEGAAQSGEVTFSAFAKNSVKSYVTGNEFFEWNFKDLRKEDGKIAPSTLDASGESSNPRTYVRDMQLSVYNEKGECDLFVNATYKQEKDGKWHANPHKFYPIGYADFDFLAYSTSASADADVAPAAAWDGAKKVTLQVTDKSLENDILYAGGKEKASTHGPAYMLFKHAQAWITVRFTASYDPSCLTDGEPLDASGNPILVINAAEWQNIYKSGELILEWKDGKPLETQATENHKADATATWNFFTQETSNVVMPDRCEKPWASGDSEAANKTKTATYGYPVVSVPESGELALKRNSYLDMLIPEQAKQALVINYTLGGEQFSYTIDAEEIIEGSKTDWKMGYHYIYNIQFYITEITTAPSVVLWKQVYGFSGDSETTTPDANDPLEL